MTKAEKAGFEVYPENISYSTLYDIKKDYNADVRRIFIWGYERGYKDTCEWLNANYPDIVEKFKKYMEE